MMGRNGHNERGFVVVLAAATVLIVLGVAALVADAGIALMGRTDLSKAVDAAALAGAQELPDNRRAARAIAADYVSRNTNRSLYAAPDVKVSFSGNNAIRVRASLALPAMFSRVLGYSELDVGASAIATRFDPDVAVIIDRSGSMCADSHGPRIACPTPGPWEPFNSIQNSAKSFVEALRTTGTIALISYSTSATLDVPSTLDTALLQSTIDGLVPSGYTDIAGSVEEAINELLLLLSTNPKLIILLTDGQPNAANGRYVGMNGGAQDNLIAAANTAKERGIIIYSIAYGDAADNGLMETVAAITEGRFYHAPDTETLDRIYAEIADTHPVRLTYVD